MIQIKIENPYLAAGDRIGNHESSFYHFPSMEKLSNGEIILCCKELKDSMNDPKGRILMFRSMDEGKSWRRGISPTCHDEEDSPEKGYLLAHVTEIDPDELIAIYSMIDTDESKPLFNPATDGMQAARVRTTKSYDNGRSWEKPGDIEFKSNDILITVLVYIKDDR